MYLEEIFKRVSLYNDKSKEDKIQYVYFLWDYSNMPNINNTKLKIGKSINPEKRCSNIITQSGNEYMKLLLCLKGNNSYLEQLLHKQFNEKRSIGEWFICNPFELIDNLLHNTNIIKFVDKYLMPKEIYELVKFNMLDN